MRAPGLLILAWLAAGCHPTAARHPQPGRAAAAPPPAADLTSDPPAAPHWVRMVAESSALFAAMEVQYWRDKELNRFDFEYDADWRNVRERFVTLEAWRLDDNYYNTNAWRHTAQGAANYLIARSNGFSSLQSYFLTLAWSGAWELFGEYKEEVSVNDLILTPRSGLVVGEALWQHGVFLLRSEPTWYHRALGEVLSGGAGVRRWLDGEPPLRSAELGPLGFDAVTSHSFRSRLAVGAQLFPRSGEVQAIGRTTLESDLVVAPGYGRPGRSAALHTGPAFSHVRLDWTRGERTLTDFRATFRIGVTTWHRKDISRLGDGYELLYGLGSAYEFGVHASRGREHDEARDRIAIGHILGPTIDLAVHRAGLSVRAAAEVYGDVGLVHNFAIDRHRALYPDDPVRSTIVRDSYHHAYGVTAGARLAARYRGLLAEVAYQLDWFQSIQGLDPHQADAADDDPLRDHRREGRLWLGHGFELASGLELALEIGAEVRSRVGTVKTTRQAEQERRYLGGVRLTF